MKEIYRRRSIRKYSEKDIPIQELKKIIKAGMNAPSARNLMPWEFIIITERKKLDMIPKFHPYSKMLHTAKAAIIVCANKNIQEIEGYWGADCGAATQNILLEIDSQTG